MNPHRSATSARRPRAAALASLLAPLALLLAGCGSSSSSTSSGNGVESKSPQEILAAAKTAASGASSVHVSGSIVNEGKSIGVDLHLVSGKGAAGTLTVEGQPIQIVEVGNGFYLKASEAFYAKMGGASAAQLLKGKWLKAPVNSGEFASLGALTSLDKLLGSTLKAPGTLTKTSTTTIAGQPAVGLADSTGKGTLYVATTGPAYPVALVKQGSSQGKITFDQWNQPVTLSVPANSVDLTQLQGG